MSEFLEHRFEQATRLPASQKQVFDFMDDFGQLGAHMMQANWMMAGSSMRYEFDATRGREVGGVVRIIGSFLGFRLEIAEQVTERSAPAGKSWRTFGGQRMLVMAGYHMGFSVVPQQGSTRLEIFIEYALPPRGFGRLLGKLFAGAYARWCVRSMLEAAIERFGQAREKPRLPGDRREHEGIST
jgi:hypothetical protein